MELYLPSSSEPFAKNKTLTVSVIKNKGQVEGVYQCAIQSKNFTIQSVSDKGQRPVQIIPTSSETKVCQVTEVVCGNGTETRYAPGSNYEIVSDLWNLHLPLSFYHLRAVETGVNYVQLITSMSPVKTEYLTLNYSSTRFGAYIPSPCFVTTACVEELGLADDCHELNALRKLRDSFVREGVKDGHGWIELYGVLGPALVKELSDHPQKAQLYRQIYRELIQESVNRIDRGDYQGAFDHYRNYLSAFARKLGF